MYADQKKVRQNQQPSNKLHLLHFLFERCGLMMMMVDDGEGEREIPFDKSLYHNGSFKKKCIVIQTT